MCGRFHGIDDPQAAATLFMAKAGIPIPDWKPNYNAAPTQLAEVILQDEARTMSRMQWGWTPKWMKGGLLINAKSETIREKKSFATAFAAQRCVIPARGFYEWRKDPDGKTPLLFTVTDAALMAMAGLWEDFIDGEEWKRRFLILTTAPNALVGAVHDRMPVLLAHADVSRWLDPSEDPASLHGLCVAYRQEAMAARPVSRLVNSVKNNGPEMVR